MSDAKKSAYDFSRDELTAFLAAHGAQKFRATQIWKWLYTDFADAWDAMSNLPKALRDELAAMLRDLRETVTLRDVAGSARETRKLLLELRDGELIETVIIPSKDRATVCVSSQSGCAFACAFCASGRSGLARSLDAGEIVAQVVHAARTLGKRPDNIVFMGVGEPFANYDNVLKAARVLNDADGLNIGARRITVSTCGVVPGIARFAQEPEQFELSVSLHAPTDALRSDIMPVNKRWPLDVLMTACRDYTRTTNRIITFEYTLVDGLNNSPQHAAALVKLLHGLKCRVNLIPLSPVPEFGGTTPSRDDCEGFANYLMAHGLNTTLRRSKGSDINAACGQLRARRRKT